MKIIKYFLLVIKMALSFLYKNVIDEGEHNYIRRDQENFYCYNTLKIWESIGLSLVEYCPYCISKGNGRVYCPIVNSGIHSKQLLLLLEDYCKEC